MIQFRLRYVLMVLAGCGVHALSLPAHAAQADSEDQLITTFTSDTDDFFRRLEGLGFAGILLVARGEETLLHAGYGIADHETGLPWTVKTISTVGSITKQFTAAAILLLQEDGMLSVNDPITKYFTDVPQDKRVITLHQLLTHSSGIVDLEGADDWDPIDRETFIRRLPKLFAITSRIPLISRTARTLEPAMTPVPSWAGFRRTLAPSHWVKIS